MKNSHIKAGKNFQGLFQKLESINVEHGRQVENKIGAINSQLYPVKTAIAKFDIS